MPLLRIPFFPQKTDYTCGPAAMRMVFGYFKKSASEKNLARRMRTNPRHGTTHQAMIRAAQQAGFYVYVNEMATLEELIFLLSWRCPVIVNYTEPSANEGHFAVVTGVTKKNVILHDPWNGKRFTLSRRSFLARWHDQLPKTYSKNWLMAISRKDFQVGKQYPPKK